MQARMCVWGSFRQGLGRGHSVPRAPRDFPWKAEEALSFMTRVPTAFRPVPVNAPDQGRPSSPGVAAGGGGEDEGGRNSQKAGACFLTPLTPVVPEEASANQRGHLGRNSSLSPQQWLQFSR